MLWHWFTHRTQAFTAELQYLLPDNVTLLCPPFDIAHPQQSV